MNVTLILEVVILKNRSYDVIRFKNAKHFEYQGLEDFTSTEIDDGIHSFDVNDRRVDLLFECAGRREDVALIFFPAAVTKNVETFPAFNGRNLARKVNASLLAFSDPALAVDGQVMTGWTLGDANYSFHQDIPEIIRHTTGDRRKIFVGISAGGYPALHFGSLFPDSLSLVVNPRTTIFNPPSHAFEIAHLLYPGLDGYEISEVIPTELGSTSNTVYYAQNFPDYKYVSSHMLPYMNKNIASENIYVRFGNWGTGHSRMPGSELAETLLLLMDAPDWGTGAKRASGMNYASVEELMSEYATLRLARIKALNADRSSDSDSV